VARDVTRLDRLGVDSGFVVVFPDGTGLLPEKSLTWNSGSVDVYASRNDVDDVDFCKAVVAEIQRRVAIDPTRVFVTGHSNGGMMCHRLAREAADVFQGIAPVAAAMNFSAAQSDVPMPVLMVHGTDDEIVPMRGGVGAEASGRKARQDVSMQQAIDYYVARNTLLAYPDVTARGGVEVQRFSRKKGDGAAPPVWVVTLDGGSHAWPGAHVRPRELQQQPFGWPASQAIVEFFASVGTGSLQEQLTPSVPR
jgi:polyhydroxybutyrate depolymerase